MGGEPSGNHQSEEAPFPRVERWGSCLAHGSTLVIGVPLAFVIGFPWSLVLCPVAAYMISRSFRRRRMAWGAFQAMQASVVQLMIFVFAAISTLGGFYPQFAFLIAGLLFLYSLAGALDSFLGFHFRYLVIGRVLEQVSAVNLERPEPRRRWFGWGNRDDG